MLTVKVSIPGASPHADTSQFTGRTDGVHNGCRFVVNASVDNPDVWLVIEGTNQDDDVAVLPRDRVAYLAAEPAVPIGYWNESASRRSYLNQFAHVWTFNDVFHRDVTVAPPFLPWMVNANHGPSIYAPHTRDVNWFRELVELPKARPLSVICSSKAFSPEHQLRLSFVTSVKEKFKDKIDWFGNGVRPIESKWEGLAPYRFTLALENRFWAGTFTEKLIDPYLALTVPIYWGAPDISDYLPDSSMVPIDIRDLKSSFEAIEGILDEDAYETYRPEVLAAKDLVLDEFNLFSRLSTVAHEVVARSSDATVRQVRIFPAEERSLARRLRRSLGWRIEALGRNLTKTA